MQAIVLGMTGSGKTTLLRNIITPDLFRVVGPPEDQHHIPMIILDNKADMEFFCSLLPHIHRAGRLGQLRVINPSRPNLSVRYNPFHFSDDNYMPVVKAELQCVARQLEATTQDRNKLQEELRQKTLIVSGLSIRLDALSKKVNGPRDSGSGAAEPMSTGPNGHGARFVGQVNRVQEELYAERHKNKRLKGA